MLRCPRSIVETGVLCNLPITGQDSRDCAAASWAPGLAGGDLFANNGIMTCRCLLIVKPCPKKQKIKVDSERKTRGTERDREGLFPKRKR